MAKKTLRELYEEFVEGQAAFTPEEAEQLKAAGEEPVEGGFSLEGLGASLAGGAAGAATGFQTGGVEGAVIGGGLGLVQGGVAFDEQQKVKAEAILRDMELEAELDAVDNLEEYIAATNVGSAGQRQQSVIEARQAAARGGLGEATGQSFAQQAAAASDFAQSQRIAAALPAASAADTAEKQSILTQEVIRQQLFDEAMDFESSAEAWGDLAAGIIKAKQIMDSPDVATGGTTTGRTTGTTTGTTTGRTTGTTTATTKSVEAGASAAKKEADDAQEVQEQVFKDSLQKSQDESYARVAGTPAGQISDHVTRAQQKEAREVITADLRSGSVTADEYQRVLELDPDALTDPVKWRNSVANMRRADASLTGQTGQTFSQYPYDPHIGYPVSDYQRQRLIDSIVE